MVFCKPEEKDGMWLVRWVHGCLNHDWFYTEEESEKFRETIFQELNEMEHGINSYAGDPKDLLIYKKFSEEVWQSA